MAVNYTPEQYDNYARTLAGLSQAEAQAKVNQDRAFIESQGGMLNEQLVNAYVNPMITTAGNRDATNNQQLGGLTGADLQKAMGQAAYSAGSIDDINNAIRKNPQYLSEQALRQSYNLTQGDVNELISKGINFPQQSGMLTQTPAQTPTPPPAQPLGMLRPTTVPERFQGKSKEQIQTMLQQDVAPVPTATEITFADTENGIVRVESGQPIPPNSTITDSDSWLEQEMNVLKQQVIDKNNVTFVDTGNGIVRVQSGQPIPKGKKTDSGSWLEQEMNILDSKVTPPKTPDGSFNYVSPATQNFVGMDTAGIMGELQKDVNPQAVTVDGTANNIDLKSSSMLEKPTAFNISQRLASGEINQQEAENLLEMSVLPPALVKVQEQEPSEFEKLVGGARTGNFKDFGTLLYSASQTGEDLSTLKNQAESIAKGAKGIEGDDAYNFLVHSAAAAQLMGDLNVANSSGNTAKASELQKALDSSETEMYNYYLTQYDEGSAHKSIEQLGYPFDIGPEGMFTTGGFNDLKRTVGAIARNIRDNPEQIAKAYALSYLGDISSAFGNLINAYNIAKDPKGAVLGKIAGYATGKVMDWNDKNITNQFAQGVGRGVVMGTAALVGGKSNLSVGKAFISELKGFETIPLPEFITDLKSFNNPQLDGLISAINEVTSKFDDEALQPIINDLKPIIAAAQKAGSKFDDKVLSEAVTAIKKVGSTLDDVAIQPGIEVVKNVGDVVAGVAEPAKDALISAGDAIANVTDNIGVPDGISDAISGFSLPNVSLPGQVSEQELAGSFTAPRGYQGPLPVDLSFQPYQDSMVMNIMNA
tara:strand:- start:1837 stop:4284 length:2448 start_codon:yes stop_codon:yes gene_type:complete